MNETEKCEHSTKLTGRCVKCGAYPYEAVTGSGNAPSVTMEAYNEIKVLRDACVSLLQQAGFHGLPVSAEIAASRMAYDNALAILRVNCGIKI